MRKPRPDAFDTRLTPAQRLELDQWLFDEQLTYAAAAARLLERFSQRVSGAALSQYYQRRAQERLLDRIAARARNAQAAQEKFKATSDPEQTYAAITQLIGQLAFEHAGTDKPDIDTLRDLATLALHARRLTLAERSLALGKDKFALLKRKADLAEAAKTATADTALTPAQLQAKLRSIFGLG
jgi:hypothetical protein